MTESSEHVTCQEVVELVTEYIEGALSPEETSGFEQHLNICDGCVRYLDQLRMTIGTVGRIGEDGLAPETREKLLTAFQDWKRS